MSDRPLGDMPPEEFRRQAHAVADWIADFLAQPGARPVLAQVTPGALAAALPTEAPAEGEEMETILADFERLILPATTHWNHPGFFAYFATTASAPGILGEMLAATLNPNGMLWRTCPAATELEQVVLGWLWQMLGLPGRCFGIIHDTASTATFHALAAAREALEDLDVRTRGLSGAAPLVVYCSEQAHSSVDKAAMTLGLGLENVRKIEVDREFRLKPDALEAAITTDLLAGRRPCCVVATVGTTSTTAVDPVPAMADICQRRRLWLHVDAAYGGSAAVVPEMSHVLAGADRADSLVVNPHKWLFTPLDLSVLYCRRPEALRRAFSLVPAFLESPEGPQAVNFMEYSLPLGRRFRALKLWFVLRYFGRQGVVANIREHLRLARELASQIAAHPDFELMAPVVFSTVCFRFHPRGVAGGPVELLNRRLMDEVNRTGQCFLSHTVLGDRFTLRLAIGNLRTTQAHVDQAWDLLQAKAREMTL